MGYAWQIRRTFPVRDRKTSNRVSFRTGSGAVMAAKRFLNFLKGRDALIARLPVPEHDEALSANAAVRFSVPLRGLAEYLHVSTSRADEAFLSPLAAIGRNKEQRTFLIGCIRLGLMGHGGNQNLRPNKAPARLGGPENSILN